MKGTEVYLINIEQSLHAVRQKKNSKLPKKRIIFRDTLRKHLTFVALAFLMISPIIPSQLPVSF